jgi:hypothetical protein
MGIATFRLAREREAALKVASQTFKKKLVKPKLTKQNGSNNSSNSRKRNSK